MNKYNLVFKHDQTNISKINGYCGPETTATKYNNKHIITERWYSTILLARNELDDNKPSEFVKSLKDPTKYKFSKSTDCIIQNKYGRFRYYIVRRKFAIYFMTRYLNIKL